MIVVYYFYGLVSILVMFLTSLSFLLQSLILFCSLVGLVAEKLQLFLFCLKLLEFLELWGLQGYWEWSKVSKDCKSWYKPLCFLYLLLVRASWFCCSIFSYHPFWLQISWETSPTTTVRTWTIFSIILLSTKPFKLSLSILLVKIGTITCTFQQLLDMLFAMMEAQLHVSLLSTFYSGFPLYFLAKKFFYNFLYWSFWINLKLTT